MESAETGAVLQDRLVHRLDRHASGALVVALTADAAAWLSAGFRAHSAHMSGTGSLPSDQSGRLQKYFMKDRLCTWAQQHAWLALDLKLNAKLQETLCGQGMLHPRCKNGSAWTCRCLASSHLLDFK